MVDLYYPEPFRFTDPERGFEYDGPGTTDVPEEAVEQYLKRGWKRTDEDGEPVDTDDSDELPDQEPASSGTGDPEHVDTDEPERAEDRQGPTTDAEADPAADPAAEVDDSEDDSDSEVVDYDELTVAEVEDLLGSREFEEDELRDLLEHERETRDRKGAKDAIEAELESAGVDRGSNVDSDSDSDSEPENENER